MPREIKKKLRNFTLDVLDTFLAIPEAITHGFKRREFYCLLSGQPHEQELSCKNIARFIHNLKHSGYIELEKSSNGESIRFTNKARLAVIDRIAAKLPADNLRYLVSFDIPERLRTNRDQFRRVIKRLGFKQVQKSLWVTNRNVGELVELAATEYKVSDYVVYIVSNTTNIDKTISGMLTIEQKPD